MSWKKTLVIIAGVFVVLFWMYIPEDEYEDPDDKYSVTFTYDCRDVNDEDVPEHVLEECKKIMKEVENDRPTI